MSSSKIQPKVLIVGDVRGKYDKLFAKVAKINTSAAGPFTALFCVGNFLPTISTSDSDSKTQMTSTLTPYINGTKSIPVPTYFILGAELNASGLAQLPAGGGEICTNLWYLGQAGVQTIHGLRIAYLSGVSNTRNAPYHMSLEADLSSTAPGSVKPPALLASPSFTTSASTPTPMLTSESTVKALHYSTRDVTDVLDSAMKQSQSQQYAAIDILLTSEWPRDYHMHCISAQLPQNAAYCRTLGTDAVESLALALTPRYHFAALHNIYYERPAYINHISSSLQLVTRFYAMGSYAAPKVGAASQHKKQKPLYAFSISPSTSMTPEELAAYPPNATRCPYHLDSKFAAHANSAFVRNAGAANLPTDASDRALKRRRTDMPSFESTLNGNDDFSRWNAKSRRAPPADYTCRICNVSGHWIQDCPQKVDRDPSKPPDGYVCNICKEPGHFIRECPNKPMGDNITQQQQQQQNQPNTPRDGYVCKICNKPGHFIRDCPVKITEDEARRQGIPPADYVCKICSQPGHFIQDCPQKAAEQHAAIVGINRSPPPDTYRCKVCNEPGHFIRDCPKAAADAKANLPPPDDYCCRICSKPGHWIQNCPDKKEASAPPQDYVCNICHKSGHYIRQCPEKQQRTDKFIRRATKLRPPVEESKNCWFCLGSADLDTHLIASIGGAAYIALDKGQLVRDHVQIVPIEHKAAAVLVGDDTAAEIKRYKEALVKYAAAIGKEVVFYERYIPSKYAQHTQIHCVPIEKGSSAALCTSLTQQGKDTMQMELKVLADGAVIKGIVNDDPYIVVELPNGQVIHAKPDPKTRNIFNFLRIAIANFIGKPERADWKTCTVSKDEEAALTEQFKHDFEQFDFALQEAEDDPDIAALLADEDL
jgi:Protein similar to CwfJ C-terminus 1/Zinc knuckle